MRRQRVPFTSEEGWAFEAHLNAAIAAQPGATFEEQLDALAKAPGWEWLNEEIELTPRAKRAYRSFERATDHQTRSSRSKLVKPLRKKLGLTQAQAADRMNVARTTVVAIEQGIRGISLEEFARLDPTGGSS